MTATESLPRWDMAVIFPSLESQEFRSEFEEIQEGLGHLETRFHELGVHKEVERDRILRDIEVEGAGLQPCGGTHVRNIAEIGGIRVTRIRNEGKRNKRVEIMLAS